MAQPIIAIMGEMGDGKTLTATALAKIYNDMGLNIFANYTLYDIPYIPVDFDSLAKFEDWLHDGVVIIDEAHVGIDAYKFFKQKTQNITLFVTQLRKKNLILILTTQRFKMLANRLRIMTSHTFQCSKTEFDNIFQVDVFNITKAPPDDYVRTFFIDGKPIYGLYDTDQIIEDN